MLKKLIAIIIVVGIFWILQWAGIISSLWIGITGFIFIIFGMLFTVMFGDTFENIIPAGVVFLIIGVILILVQPASLI